jgi:hypothetical protein
MPKKTNDDRTTTWLRLGIDLPFCRSRDLRALTASAALGCVKRIGMVMVGLLLTAAGCGSNNAPPQGAGTPTTTASGSASASGRPSGSPSASAGQLIEFTVDGAGPYLLGSTLTALQAKPGLDEVTTGSPGCPENTFARGTGVWRDVRLSFRKDGKLYLALNRSDSIPTPSGAWLGTTYEDLKKIYAGVMGQDLTRGPNSAYLVQTLSGGGILFELGPDKKVISMAAADAGYLRSTFTAGTEYC